MFIPTRRSFILSRPTRGRLKKQGILRERVFGCDLSEHLVTTGQDGEGFLEFLFLRKIVCIARSKHIVNSRS